MTMFQTFTVHSEILQREKTIRILLPKTYQNSSIYYPVIYMHDGQNVFHDKDAFYGNSWCIEDCLQEADIEAIVVGIDCNEEGTKRFDEYTPWEISSHINKGFYIPKEVILGGEGKLYVDFLVEELKPLIDKQFRTLPEDNAMIGSSAGGVISTYALCQYPHIFTKVAALSNAYWLIQDEIETLMKNSDVSSVEKFYLDVGTNEESGLFGPNVYVSSNQFFHKVVKEKGMEHRFEIIQNAVHNELAWRKRLPDILCYLYEK